MKINAINKSNPPAVILGLGVNGLGIARSLGKENITIYGLYSGWAELGRFSRYLRPVAVADFRRDPRQLLQQLVELADKINERAFLIPESDGYLSFISDNRDILSRYFVFHIPNKDLVDKILEKNGNMELAIQHDVLIPQTTSLEEKSDLEKVINEFKFPVIIKPLDTFSTQFPGNAKNIIIETAESLLNLVHENEILFGNSVIQELIVGLDGNIVICSVYFSEDSLPLGVYTGRKIRQLKPDFGVTCCGISEYIPEIEKISIKFLKAMQYSGLGTLEFARDVKTGKYYFLEINGRSYYHNTLFTDCNVNLSYIAYCDTVGLKIPEHKYKQREGLVWIDFSRDAQSFLLKRKAKTLNFAKWVRSVLKARSFAVFNKQDILPFLYASLLFSGVMLKKLIGNLAGYFPLPSGQEKSEPPLKQP